MSKTVTVKEAAFMLDTDMEQDMKSYVQEITLHAIKHINSTPELYVVIKEHGGQSIENVCTAWAESHGDEFGDLFISELESVDWEKVKSRV